MRMSCMNRRCVAALFMSVSIIAAGCAPSDGGQEPDDDAPPTSASPTVEEDANPDDGY